MSNLIGQSLGRYQILEQLGEGGMATVYKAFDARLERDVAIKIIRTDQFAPAVLERILKRFEREAKALARLTHPNIVGVIDYGEHEGAPYLVMPYLPGGTLKQYLGKPMPWQDAVHILLPVAQALEYAHEHNIIHRDIKPSNILLTEKGQPMLSDFGIAKILESDETATLTGTGVGVGTPEYMAPEQWTGHAGLQSDIYSLGVVFYELITGRKPYVADTPAAILLKQATDPLPRPRQYVSDLPDAVERILLKALAHKIEDRYHEMGVFASALANLSVGQGASDIVSQQKPFHRDSTMATVEQSTGFYNTQATEEQPSEPNQSLPRVRPVEKQPIPGWRSIIWITLGWAIGLAISEGITREIFRAIGSVIGWIISREIGIVIGMAIGGFITALALYREKIFTSWKNVLWVTLGWIISGVVELILVRVIGGALTYATECAIFALGLAIGGLGTSFILRKEKILASWKNILWIILGWAVGGAIVGEVMYIGIILEGNVAIYGAMNAIMGATGITTGYTILLMATNAIGGASCGLIGGAIMIWHLRKEGQMA
jgi:serine/threonine protein kinase